jgi:hypothetical protein
MSKYFCSISPEKDTVVLDLKKLFPDLMSNVSIKVGNISSGNDEYVNNNIYINSVKCNVLGNEITNNVRPFLTTVRVDCTNGITPCSFDLIINNDVTNKSVTVYVSDGDVQIVQDCEFDAL